MAFHDLLGSDAELRVPITTLSARSTGPGEVPLTIAREKSMTDL
jgi:hypothetical protein